MFILLTFVIKLYVIVVIYVLKFPAKCFLLISNLLSTHLIALAMQWLEIQLHLLAAHVRDKDSLKLITIM